MPHRAKDKGDRAEKLKPFMPGVEVNGQAILSFLEVIEPYRQTARRILADQGIPDPQRGTWYPQQAWLEAFRAIAQQIGPNALYEIGRKIPDTADWPVEIDSVERALASIDTAYHMNHRGGAIGNYFFTMAGDRTGTMTCSEPYPCDFDRGIVEAMAAKFTGTFSLQHEGTQCRKKGDPCCVYRLTW